MITLEPVTAADAETLADIRVEAMRESLERIGRFDPVRARSRFLDTFVPAHTRAIVQFGERAGFVVVRPQDGALCLDHLYVLPSRQNAGIGAAVLRTVFAQADACGAPVRVGALRASESNRFYTAHGFALVEEAEFDNYYVRVPKVPSTLLSPLPALPPGKYRHYKGGEYEVVGVVRHSESKEPMVLYRPLYNDTGLWVRPYAMFVEFIEVDGRTVQRFAPVPG